ncbi:hypothetical protein MNB_SM-3-432 [hydrothermal vent metagenome]|uniref:Lipoprotein n=1 Tax=hydrothermal vent metagenome TaxID=652676 RepID=A0A1W1D1N3_9ZZZZ
MKKIFLSSFFLLLPLFIIGCGTVDVGNPQTTTNQTSGQISELSLLGDNQGGSTLDNGNQITELSQNSLAQSGNNGMLNINMNSFGGDMGSMSDIDALMNGKAGPPKKYRPRFIMMGEVNVTIDGRFYHLASVDDDQQQIPASRFIYEPTTHKFFIQIVGAPVYKDKLMANFYIIIKFPLDPLGNQPFMQQSTVIYPPNVQSMVKAGGRPYYWGYLMGGGGYWVVMDQNNQAHMAQFAFGAFVMPSRN